MIILNVTPFFLLVITELFILVTFTISYYHFKKNNIILGIKITYFCLYGTFAFPLRCNRIAFMI